MKKCFIHIIISMTIILANDINESFGKIIFNDIHIDSPFSGGFNKPKIQWIDWDFDGEFISSYWNNQYINTNGIFETQTFNYWPVNSWFEFEKPKPGPAGKDPYYERILFTLYDFDNKEGMDYNLLIKYLVRDMGEDAIYKCFEPTKPVKGGDGIYRMP